MDSLPVFSTERLILRGVTEEDVPAYERYFVDYEVISHQSSVGSGALALSERWSS